MKENYLQPVTRGIILCFMLILCYTQMTAQTFTSGNFGFTITDATKHEVEMTSTQVKTGTLVIPETVDYNGTSYTVTSIGERACDYLKGTYQFTSITFPNTIRTIGENAFRGCKTLTTLELPTSLTRINNSAFDECSALTSVNIPASLKSIGEYVFRSCNISKVSITDLKAWLLLDFESYSSNPMNKRQQHLYLNGKELINPEIPSDITEIKKYAFYNCLGIQGDLVIPDNIKKVGEFAYYCCDNIESIYLPASLKEVGDYAFSMSSKGKLNKMIASSYSNFLKINFGLWSGPWLSAKHLYDASNGNQEITEITFPEDVTEIGGGNFAGGPWEKIVVPSHIKRIGKYGFNYCTNLKEIVLPEGLDSIHDHCFYNTPLLEKINIPSTVKYIGPHAFDGASALKGIDLPEGLETIGKYAFYYCLGFEKIIIPSNVKEIGFDAFGYCKSLKEVVIPESLDTLGQSAFVKCDSLEKVFLNMYNPTTAYCPFPTTSSARFIVPAESLKSYTEAEKWAGLKDNMVARLKYEYNDDDMTAKVVCDDTYSVIPKGYVPDVIYKDFDSYTVTALADYAFKNSSTMESVEFANTVTSMGNYVFSGCKKLTDVTLPETVTRINEGTFYGCESLADYVIPQKITAIDRMAFNGCKSLKTVRIPDTQTEVGDSTFFGCSTLTQITIPSAVKSIGTDAFRNCNGLSRVDIKSIYDWLDIDFHSAYANPLGHAHRLYENGSEYTALSLEDDEEIEAVKDYAFFKASNLEKASIIYSMESIGKGAFQDCAKLSEIKLPRIKTIGDFAFSGCSGIKSRITIPSTLTSIGYSAFEGCVSIPEVGVHRDIKYWMGVDLKNATSNPLTYAHKLIQQEKETTEINVPNDISDIKPFVFSGCRNIKTVNITNSSTKIGKGAFNDCRSLVADFNNLIRNNSEIEDSTFYNCNNITGTIKLPEHTNRIGDYILYGCEKLTGQLTLPNNITSIGEGAFGGCKNISGIAVVPSSVKRIGKKAFYNCSSIERSNLPEGLEYVGDSAFYNCSGLQAFFIPEETPLECGTDAFGGTITPASRYLVPLASLDSYKAAPVWSNVKDNISPMLAYTYNEKDHTAEIDAGNYESYSEFCIPSVLIYNGELYNVTSTKEDAFSTAVGYNTMKPVYIDDLAAWLRMDIPSRKSNPGDKGGLFLKGVRIKDLVIPDTVTYIKPWLFENCSFNSIHIPPSVKKIGTGAFYNCTLIEKYDNLSYPPIHITDLKAWIYIEYTDDPKYEYTPLGWSGHLFLNGKDLTDIIIPDGVEVIKSGAFAAKSIRGYLYIPSSVKKIEPSAFGRYIDDICNITSVRVEDINAWMNIDFENRYSTPFQKQGPLCDKDGKEITEIVVPESITKINNYKFYNVNSLKKITLPDNMTSIGNGAFANCSALQQCKLPKNLTSIENSAFANCSALQQCKLPKNLTTIKDSVFFKCTSLSGEIYLPKTIKEMGEHVFYNCPQITSVTFDNNITSSIKFNNDVFYRCTAIKNLHLPNTLERIEQKVFGFCENLQTVVIPKSVNFISWYSFSYCPKLSTIISLRTEPCRVGGYTIFGDIAPNAVLYVPAGSVDKYKSAYGWKDIADIREMPEKTITITSAGYSTFYSPFQYIVPSGLTAYVLRKIEDNVATLSPLGANSKGEVIIPGQTAVVLKGAQGNYTFKPTTEYGTNVENLLEGFFTTADVLSDGVMTLGVVDGKVGFYNYTGSVLNEYKAFLPKRNLPDEVASGAKKLAVEFDFEVENTPTDITEIREETQEKDVIYTIEGVKVDKIDHKGIYIRNGKKIFVK